MLGDNAASTEDFSSMYFFSPFPMDEARIKKDFYLCLGRTIWARKY